MATYECKELNACIHVRNEEGVNIGPRFLRNFSETFLTRDKSIAITNTNLSHYSLRDIFHTG